MNFQELLKSTGKYSAKRLDKSNLTGAVKLGSQKSNDSEYVFTCLVHSDSSNKNYTCNLAFDKGKTNKLKELREKVVATELKTNESIDVLTQDVKVFCDCPDFEFNFAYLNNKHDCFYGKYDNDYVKKTDRKVKNEDYPGVCKHLMSAFEFLKDKRFIK